MTDTPAASATWRSVGRLRRWLTLAVYLCTDTQSRYPASVYRYTNRSPADTDQTTPRPADPGPAAPARPRQTAPAGPRRVVPTRPGQAGPARRGSPPSGRKP